MQRFITENTKEQIVSRKKIRTGRNEWVEEQTLLPSAIEAFGGENVQRLFCSTPRQIVYHAATPLACVWGGDTLILDFAQEQNGGICLFTDAVPQNATVRIRFGESYSECNAELGQQNATNDHAVRDVTLPLSAYSKTAFGETGYRYVRLDFFCQGQIRLKNVYGTCRILSQKPKYVCPQSGVVGQIYQTAKRTIDLCATEYLVDGVKRDRLVWVGDMHPEMLALTTLYGNSPCLERSLDLAREETPLPNWMNGFPSYSLWWVVILADYKPFASAAFLARQKEYLQRLIRQLSSCVDEGGNLTFPSYFFDWQTHESEEEKTGVFALFLLALNKAKELFFAYGLSDEPIQNLIKKLAPLPQSEKKQVIAIKYLACGKMTEREKQLLITGGAKGMSTFMSYYILHAVASFSPERAVAMMQEYYGAMLSLGATTFWEDFSIEWTENAAPITRRQVGEECDVHGDFGAYCYRGFRHSLCHGWATGVLRFLQEQFPA